MQKHKIEYWVSWLPLSSVIYTHNWKRYCLTLLYLLTITLLLFISRHSVADNAKVITLNTTTKPPLSTSNQQGFLDLIATTAMSRIGLKLEILALPAERALLDANAGILDGELARVPGIEKAYKNLILIPEKLMDVEFTIFSIKHNSIAEPGWDGLQNTSVAFLNGWKILERNVPKSAEITKVNSPTQLFNLLKFNRVDYIIYEKWGGIALAKSMGIENVNTLSPPLAVRQLHIYLHRKHQEHASSLANALKQLKDDGTYQNIYNETLGPFTHRP